MKKEQPENKNERQSTTKLTFLFIMLPVLVVILMVIFWLIFKETRKQVEITAYTVDPVIIVVSEPIDVKNIKCSSYS